MVASNTHNRGARAETGVATDVGNDARCERTANEEFKIDGFVVGVNKRKIENNQVRSVHPQHRPLFIHEKNTR